MNEGRNTQCLNHLNLPSHVPLGDEADQIQ